MKANREAMRPTILVTGATSGLGAEITRKFVAEGWQAIITGRREKRLHALVKELGNDYVYPLAFDIQEADQIDTAIDSLPESFRNIDLLVNNAGLALGREPAQETNLKHSRQMIETNISGLVIITRKLLPALIKQKGAIINISSVSANQPYLGGNVYGGTKAFVSQYSKGLRVDLHGTGVRVTTIEPGLMETEFTLVRTEGDAEASAEFYRGKNPLTPVDVANMVWWAALQPPHININLIDVMPVSQSLAGFQIHQESG